MPDAGSTSRSSDAEAARGVRRTVVLVGVFALTIAVALAYGRLVRQSASGELDDRATVFGPIAAKLPAGWAETRDDTGGSTEILAVSPEAETEETFALVRVAATRLPEDDELTTPMVLGSAARRRLGLAEDLAVEVVEVDAPRPARVAGEPGLIATYGYEVGGLRLGGLRSGELIFYRTIAAATVEGWAIEVAVERFGEWNGRDALLTRAVAESVTLRE